MAVDCKFYVREQVSDEPTYRYIDVALHSLRGDGARRTEHPPLVGDLVSLYDEQAQVNGSFVVIKRSWSWSSYGSYNWPLLADAPTVPDALYIICEAEDGPFVNAVREPDSE